MSLESELERVRQAEEDKNSAATRDTKSGTPSDGETYSTDVESKGRFFIEEILVLSRLLDEQRNPNSMFRYILVVD